MAADSLPPVLLVDDSDDDLRLLKRYLAKAGVKNPIVTHSDAPAAIAFLAAAAHGAEPMPCLVLTDLKMPGIDGFDFIKWIRRQKPLKGLKVAMISGSGVPRDASQAKAAGADAFFAKFPTPAELAQLAHEASGC
jgi:two-component system, response regulator